MPSFKKTISSQYDSKNLNWQKEGSVDSPTRIFFREYLKSNFIDIRNKIVLDIGSGTGHLVKLLKNLGAKEMYGIEPSKNNIKLSKENFPEMKVFLNTLEKFRTKKQFDVVVSIMAFEHIKNIKLAFRKIHKLLKTGGYFYLIFGDKDYHSTERFGYSIKTNDLKNGEIQVFTKRPYGTLQDIFRPIKNFIDASDESGLKLEKHIPLKPNNNLIKNEPKYEAFKDIALCHLMIFKK